MRLFIAILLPEEVKNELCRRRDLILKDASRGNGTQRENLHLTLAFLGEVSGTGRIQKIKSAMNRMEASPFAFSLGGLGRFSGNGESLYFNRLLSCPDLMKLQEELSQQLQEEGFVLEKRKFKPHLTLSRRTVLFPEKEQQLLGQRFSPLKVPVTEICLMKSERLYGKLTYTKLYGKTLVFQENRQEEET